MRPTATLANTYPCDDPSVRMRGDPIIPNGGLLDRFENDKWSTILWLQVTHTALGMRCRSSDTSSPPVVRAWRNKRTMPDGPG
jgi:hypothetical protein